MPDVDGYTSALFFYSYLNDILRKNYNFEIEYHIPEGKEHGLKTLMSIFQNKRIADLIVCPDSSSNDYEYHKILHDMGYDILVLDHHLTDYYSENAVVVNNQLSKNYKNKALSGVGIVYKFFEHFEKKYYNNYDVPPSQNYLDLVALGQISDMMNMNTLENRYICNYGLTHINNKFFNDLLEKQAYSIDLDCITQIDIAFYITPLINALIRVGSNLEKERLFEAFINPNKKVPSTKRGEKNLEETISTQAVRNCVNAKAKQNREKEKAIELLNIQIEENCLDDNKIIILNADELNISNNLTGLCAMGIAAQYKKPVMLGRVNKEGYMKGSIRGREESELKNFKKFLLNSNLMQFVEGHPNAAGFSLRQSNIDKLIKYANEKLANINFNEGCYEVDFIVNGNCSYLNSLIEDLDRGKRLFGQANEEPLIVVEDITIDSNNLQIIGKNNDTLKFIFNGITYIKFRAKDIIEQLKKFDGKICITVVGKPNMNYWNGTNTPQILLEDMDFKKPSAYDF